ncbi:MAG: prolipoprotein diacylglyceryl transferase [Cyanobacteria bacterium REEB65]|nr:prolipoprotein diacylglyceryl transferase [Cyanobacteria bacterium REEB65]
MSPLILTYPHFNPIAFQLGPLAVHWYGLMYLCAFWFEYWLLNHLNRRYALGFEEQDISDLIGHLILGVVLGGRLGYVLFYNLADYLRHPLEIFAVWHGGMSFHGGLIGTLMAGWWWCRKKGVSFLDLADLVIVGVPIGLALGRLGNFINGELWGKEAPTVPWAMVFPTGGPIPRHPSQIYELLLEGFFLFTLLLFLYSRRVARGVVIGSFLTGYGCIRIFVEFFRNADPQFITPTNPNGDVLGLPLHMGQVLSVPMVVAGLTLIAWALSRPKDERTARLGRSPIAAPPAGDAIGTESGS